MPRKQRPSISDIGHMQDELRLMSRRIQRIAINLANTFPKKDSRKVMNQMEKVRDQLVNLREEIQKLAETEYGFQEIIKTNARS